LFERLVAGASRILQEIGALCLLLVFLLISADVALRYALNAPIAGTLEISEFAPVIITYCFFALAALEDRHIRATFLVERLPAPYRRFAAILADVLMLAFVTVLIWQTTKEAVRSWAMLEISQGLISVPRFPVKTLIPVGLAVGWLIFLLQLIAKLTNRRGQG